MSFRRGSVGKIYKLHTGGPNSMGVTEECGAFPCRLQFNRDTETTE